MGPYLHLHTLVGIPQQGVVGDIPGIGLYFSQVALSHPWPPGGRVLVAIVLALLAGEGGHRQTPATLGPGQAGGRVEEAWERL